MIFANMIHLNMGLPQEVVKVGDTASDMQEARNAGVWAVGVVRGSSMLGLTEREADEMDPAELAARIAQAKQSFLESGAHAVIEVISELPAVIEAIDRSLAKGGFPGGIESLHENGRGALMYPPSGSAGRTPT